MKPQGPSGILPVRGTSPLAGLVAEAGGHGRRKWHDPATEVASLRWALSIVAFAVIGLLVLAPLGVVFGEASRDGVAGIVSALAAPEAQAAIRLTLTVAAISVPLNALFGLAAAWLVTRFDFRGKALLVSLIDLPFSVSPVVAGLCLVFVFGANAPLGHALEAQGLKVIFAFPGVLLATIFVTFPFVARELIPLMQEQGRAEEEAAMTLGAGPLRLLLTVTLPKVRWALLYGVLLCNARAMGEFGAVAVVSGRIRGETATIPVTIEMLYNEYLSTAAFALAALLSLIALLTLALKAFIERGQGKVLAGSLRH